MPYQTVVCIKQVPDTANISGQAMKPDGTVNRAALPAIFNPDDLHALEAALSVREQFGGSVTVLTMGPPAASEILRESLYRGADRAILITDRRAAGSDTLATSYILCQAIRTIGRFDIVFCGRQAIDGDTAQVGPQLAEKLGIPQITYCQRIVSLDGQKIRVRRDVGSGYEILESPLPVLLTVLETANTVRPPAARRVLRFKRARAPVEIIAELAGQMPDASTEQKEAEQTRRLEALRSAGLLIEQWDLDRIGADLRWCGLGGSPTKVHRIQSIVLTRQGYTEIPPTEAGIRQVVRELIVDHTLG